MKKLTVADILQLDILKNVTICAGAAGLSHFVTGITTAEDPDYSVVLRAVGQNPRGLFNRSLLRPFNPA